MKPSAPLQTQMDRLANTGAFNLSQPLKLELKELLHQLALPELTNLDCGTCLRTAMHNLNAYLSQVDATPVLSMKMVKQPNEMTYQELRKAVKAKGLKTSRNPNKAELIKLLS